MKLIIVIMTTFLLQVSASTLAQKITLNEQNVPLDKILLKIRAQSGYDFISNNELIKGAGSLSIRVNEVSLDEALRILFTNQNLTYLIQDKAVVIKEKRNRFLDGISDVFSVIDVRGRVLDEKGLPLSNASIKIKGTTQTYSTNENGEFVIKDISLKSVLQISFVGYETKEIFASEFKPLTIITLKLIDNKLQEVAILSTGYQNISKERATGSFELIDNKLFNRSAGTDIVNRLDGIANSLFLDKGSPVTPISRPVERLEIRGISTFRSTDEPLIVVDNFPYRGSIDNINPNDVENITILKDAAAASIWGSSSGNGVIVITTKRGKYEQPLRISLNNNVSVSEKTNLFHLNKMSVSDYIDVEKYLFDKGFYDERFDPSISMFYNNSPVVDLLARQRSLEEDDVAGRAQIDKQIDEFRHSDIRKDYTRYIYRNSVNQQYSANISGGAKQVNYIFSGGYDKNLNDLVTSSYDRISLRANTTFKVLKNLNLETTTQFTKGKFKDISVESPIAYGSRLHFPYARLADDSGNPLIVENAGEVSNVYRNNEGNGNLLDWNYRPLKELNASTSINRAEDFLVNLGANYKINSFLSASVKYQYEKTNGQVINNDGVESYTTRNQINRLTQYDSDGIIARPIPVGGIIVTTNQFLNSNNLRGQIDFNKDWKKHEVNAIFGAEIKENHTWSNTNIIFGYDDSSLSYKPVDFVTRFPALNGLDGNENIFNPIAFTDITNRFTSLFANAGYNYDNRYNVTASIRKDAANLFGAKPNKRGLPFWSAGIAWNLSNEAFYKSAFLPFLKFRLTYGYNGNANGNLSGNPIMQRNGQPNQITMLSFARIQSPPNPSLSWERIGMLNLGIDFGMKNNRITGSVEYYHKRGLDLISPSKADPTTGFPSLLINSANISGKGIDVTLNTVNLTINKLQWASNILFSYNRQIVTQSFLPNTKGVNFLTGPQGSRLTAVTKRDMAGLYTFKWAGLDPENGDPRGYDTDGAISKDYTKLFNVDIEDMDFHGSTRPVYFGALRNTISLYKFSCSFNITYRLGHYFLRDGIDYNRLFNNGTLGHGEYVNRWQKPGDEKITNVPSIGYPANSSRDNFYLTSSALVSKADVIRLQDVNLSYNFDKNRLFTDFRLYANVTNLGILWRANKHGIDPDYGMSIPPQKTFILGFSANF